MTNSTRWWAGATIALVCLALWLLPAVDKEASREIGVTHQTAIMDSATSDAGRSAAQLVEVVRSPVEWLVLRPTSAIPGQRLSGARLGVWSSSGVRDLDFIAVQQFDVIVVAAQPMIGDQRICVMSDGCAPLDVTALVLQGGHHTCVLEPAAQFEIAVQDMEEAEAGVAIRLEADSSEPGSTARVVWPTSRTAGAYRFDLPRGKYDLAAEDESTLIWSGGEPVVVDNLTPLRRTLVLVGLVAAAMRAPMGEIRTFKLESVPAGLLTVHEVRIQAAAERLRAEWGPVVQIEFAATRSLTQRRLTHDAVALLGTGDGSSTRHNVTFHPLDQIVVYDVHMVKSRDSGRLRVSVQGPSGSRLDGVDSWVYENIDGRAGRVLAVLKSGDDWRSMVPGKYVIKPRLPANILSGNGSVEATVTAGQSTDAVIPISKNLVAAYLHIELKDGGVPKNADVRIVGDGLESVYSSTKPERIRVWVPPTKLAVEVCVSDDARTLVEIDFAATVEHKIVVDRE